MKPITWTEKQNNLMNIQSILLDDLIKMKDDQIAAVENDIDLAAEFTLTEIISEINRRKLQQKEHFPVCDEQPEWTTAHTEQSI